jgi:hypothetical protein
MMNVSDDERRQAEQTLDRMMKEIDRIKAAERRRREMEDRLLHRMVDAEGQLQEAKSVEVSMIVEVEKMVDALQGLAIGEEEEDFSRN